MKKQINYLGICYHPQAWREITDTEWKNFVDQFYRKPSLEEVKYEMKRIASGTGKMSNIVKYFLKDIMAMTKSNLTNWSFHDLLKCKDLVGCYYARFEKNKNLYSENASLSACINTAQHIGGVSLAHLPTQYKIKDVKKILLKYNVNNNYYDFSCGWGARMLASLSENVNYFGTDPNYLLCERLEQIKNLYKEVNGKISKVDIRCQGSEKFIPEWKNKMGLAFTSPPYFDCECYRIGQQSYIEGKTTYEGWLNNYLDKTIKNIYEYLIDDGYFVINIKDFHKKTIEKDTKKIAEKNRFKLINTESLYVQARPHCKKEIYKNNNENIFVFKKNK